MTLRRIEWLDTLRAFGIFIVFLGHTTLTNKLVEKYIFSFHMPLFFFISGIFFKAPDTPGGFRNFFLNKIKTRMIPYVSFGILTYVLWLLPILLRKYGVYHGSNAIPDSLYYKPFIGMLYGSGEPHNGILWFLACLFVTEIIFYGTYRTGKTVRNISLILIFFAFLGYVDALYTPIRFPFSANIAFSAVVFYGIGYLLKDLLIDSDLEVGWTLVCLSIGLIIAFLNDRVDMNYRWYGNPILFYASSLLSIYAFISLFKKIPHNSLTDYVGQNSLIFFLLQNIGFSIVNVLSYLMLHSKLNSGELNLLCAIGYVFLSILVLFPVAYFINNKMPIITGKIPSRDKVKQMSAQQF